MLHYKKLCYNILKIRKECEVMENSKICQKCGTINNLEAKFCQNCGTEIIQNNTVNTIQNSVFQNENNNIKIDNQIKNNDHEGNKLGIISLVLYFAATIVTTVITSLLPENIGESFSALCGLCPLAGIVIMIVGRVKYPDNKLLKVVMWVIIGSIIISIILFIIFCVWCYVTCTTMKCS